jgi:serine/threonine protein kinase
MDYTTAKNFVMTSSNQVGSFLVRQNKNTGIFSVTIRDKDKPLQFHICKQENGMLYLTEQYLFRSISTLIQHYSKKDNRFTKPCIVPHCISDWAEVTWDEKVATGQFSEVWKGQWKGEAVTINKIISGSVSSLDLLDKCAFLKTIDHENLIQFRAMHTNSEPYIVITECTVNGNLKEYLPSQFESKDFKMAELIKISEQVAAAMKYLEEQKCIHQDLAAKNVLIDIDHEESLLFRCKLNVYPYVHKLSEYGEFYDLPSGTVPIRWSPQEAILKNRINIKSNVWSFGIFIWEIIHYCRGYPYPETAEAEVLEKLKQGYRMPRPLGCPEELYSLLCNCWKEDADSRPTFDTLHWQLRDFYTSDSFGYQQVELIK